MGIANHTPVICKNLGKTKRKINVYPKVRKKDIGAEAFPLDNVVNKAETKNIAPGKQKITK